MGKIGVINPRQIRIVYAKRLSNLGLIHLVNQAFDRLKASLSMYGSDDVPYTRMHFKPLRKNNENSVSVQATSLPAGHDTVISVNILKPLGPDESYIPNDNTVDESYSLNIDRTDMSLKIDMSAVGGVGILRAFSTLSSMFEFVGDQKFILGGLPIAIRDKPRFEWRGLMIDTSRHYIPIDSLKKIVNGMERLKMNVLHWHLVDSQSFPFESVSYPNLSKDGAYNAKTAIYSVAQIKNFVQYCTKRGVRIVPEFDMPAHTASWGGLGY